MLTCSVSHSYYGRCWRFQLVTTNRWHMWAVQSTVNSTGPLASLLRKKIHIWGGVWREASFDLQTKLVISVCLQIHIYVTPVDQETSGPGLITMLNVCPHDTLPFASPFVYLLICSDCIKCDCFICSGPTHWLRPAPCLLVHQFTSILRLITTANCSTGLEWFSSTLSSHWNQTCCFLFSFTHSISKHVLKHINWIMVIVICYSGLSNVWVSLMHLMCNHALAPCQAAAGQTYIFGAYTLDLGVVNTLLTIS